MKKLLFAIFFVTTLISCETEPLDPSFNNMGNNNGGSGGGNNVTASIVGTWDYTDAESMTTTTATVMGSTVTLTTLTEFVSSNAVAVFNADGTYTVNGDLTTESFSQGISAGQTTNTFAESGTYTVNGTEIIFMPVGGANNVFEQNATFSIDTLTATDFEISVESDVMQNVGGISQSIEVDGFVLFTR